ncbi:MAG TPA: helix-turn-helix transcriptional regulator [Longimicrobium sp.]|nr:helix-turn-helix transcriptional regulator [Longimicrobium sp.]
MPPFEPQSPGEMARALAGRARTLRLLRGWTQQEAADRSGLTLATYQRFERTGRIALDRLAGIAVTLDAGEAFGQLFALPPAQSLPELAERTRHPPRQRGRRPRPDP